MRRVAVVLALVASAVCADTALHAEPRAAQVAGAFYPADPDELRTLVTTLLEQQPAPADRAPRLLIAPHAGYPYSGPVAAAAFRQVQGRPYDAVVVVGFTHRLHFSGASVDDADAYDTPLGRIPVHQDAVRRLLAHDLAAPRRVLGTVEQAHASGEHSLEVMLPFLQVAVPDVRLVPILFGSTSADDARALARLLATLSREGNYLFVFSTDLSHYHPYEQAQAQDTRTLQAITRETPAAVMRLFKAGRIEACGYGPILAALSLSAELGYLEAQVVRYANSGDTAGAKHSVVGYGAVAFHERATRPQPAVSDPSGLALVDAARQVLVHRLANGPAPVVDLQAAPDLAQPLGLFVTLRRRGLLRGCMGRIQTPQPLHASLPAVALEAATADPRFPPVTAGELAEIHLDVSVLTPMQRVPSAEAIVAGRDGVVLMFAGRSGVFLPSVWQETAWTREEFLNELASQKTGVAPESWRSGQLFVFQAQEFAEPARR